MAQGKTKTTPAPADGAGEVRTAVSWDPDHPFESNGEPVESLLERGEIVEAIADAILAVNPPFTLGIYGGWGSGKTHFMKSVQEAIDKKNKRRSCKQKVITVWYEAWQHQREANPALSMLFSAYDSFSLFNEVTEDVSEKCKAVLRTLFDSLPEFEIGVSVGSPDQASSASAKMKVSPGTVRENWNKNRKKEKERRFQVAEEQARLQKRYEEVLDTLSGLDTLTSKRKYKVVFFIDDLDRCLPETVIDMLEKIKLFLAHESCVFVIGADSEAVEYAIRKVKGYGERQGEKGEETKGEGTKGEETARFYLEKIVNFPFRLPLISRDASKTFLEKKLEAWPDKDVVVPIFQTACDEKGASLRHMIQLTNAFMLNDSLLRRKIDNYQPEIMAVVTALHVLWVDEFNRICRSEKRRDGNLRAFFLPGEYRQQPLEQSEPSSPSEPSLVDEIGARLPELSRKARELSVPENTPFKDYVEFLVSASTVAESPDEDISPIWYAKIPTLAAETMRGDLDETIKWIADNPPAAGAEPKPRVTLDGYVWRVLTVSENKALLLSEQIIGHGPLDATEYPRGYKYAWAECSLNRELNSDKWLDSYLPQLAQSEKISDRVPSSYHSDEQLGRIFLLSVGDLNDSKFFLNNDSRSAVDLKGRAHWWWLRSPGIDARYAAYVYPGGSVTRLGGNVVDALAGVRPAFWLNL